MQDSSRGEITHQYVLKSRRRINAKQNALNVSKSITGHKWRLIKFRCNIRGRNQFLKLTKIDADEPTLAH